MTRLLVTGASGFIAGHCVIDLLNHGYEVEGQSVISIVLISCAAGDARRK